MADLHEAAAEGAKETVERLLAEGADVHARKEKGWEILNRALAKARKQTIVPPYPASDAWTPLMLAAAGNGHEEVTAVVLAHGANINVTDKDGCMGKEACCKLTSY
jgi:ankyrin repeat protein